MVRRFSALLLFSLVLSLSIGCTNKKVSNPLANLGSKQPDKVLFDRAMDQLKHNRYDQARMILQTLINTYSDSEFIARAKLAVADSWYAEGGSTAMTQAEIEYKDFITFFPNMPEAAEAQLKIANIHYNEMEKPDRDYTHARRAEDEYRNLILQFPDSKLVPEAKIRLMEVQEVLAEREYRIGQFYYLRQSYPAAIARLKSVIDRYPLYSRADEALYALGQSYEGEIAMLRNRKMDESAKARLMEQFKKDASAAYSKIITRYPLQDRSEDAEKRLQALEMPVPRPTKAAVAQNKKEIESREESGMMNQMLGSFRKHPDVAQATRVGEPPLVNPKETSATEVVQAATKAMIGGGAGGNNTVTVETVGKGAPPPSEAAPRSDSSPETQPAATPTASADTQPATGPAADNPATPTTSAGELVPNTQPADPNELKPNTELKPNADPGTNLPPPQQVNELNTNAPAASVSSSSGSELASPEEVSSSKKKKKKGIKKVVPF
ncbi:MAG TPA: outer membrane protein assembly factor BamD [Terriglobales bacterium]|jgi:outer membrane protein assembly factor BamD|nr:outer membrane protein assembly factor BamD [Terriglobales bacterium]